MRDSNVHFLIRNETIMEFNFSSLQTSLGIVLVLIHETHFEIRKCLENKNSFLRYIGLVLNLLFSFFLVAKFYCPFHDCLTNARHVCTYLTAFPMTNPNIVMPVNSVDIFKHFGDTFDLSSALACPVKLLKR